MANRTLKTQPGVDAWCSLPDKLLSEQGKALVSSDPDLSEQTLRLLSEIEQHKDEDMKCSFEDVCFYDKEDTLNPLDWPACLSASRQTRMLLSQRLRPGIPP